MSVMPGSSRLQLFLFHQERLYHPGYDTSIAHLETCVDFFSSFHPVACRHGGGRGGVPRPPHHTPTALRLCLPGTSCISSFLRNLGMTLGLVMGVPALIANAFSFFSFLWGLPPSMPGLLVKILQTSFPFLEC